MNALAISGFAIGFPALFVSIFLFVIKKNKLQLTLAIQNLGIALWGFGCVLAALSKTPLEAMFWWKVALTTGLPLAPLVLHHILLLNKLSRKRLLISTYIWSFTYPLVCLFGLDGMEVSYFLNSFYFPKPVNLFYRSYYSIWLLVAVYATFLILRGLIKCSQEEKAPLRLYSISYIMGLWGGGTYPILAVFNINLFYPYGNFLLPIYCILITYAILRYGFLDINLIIKKTLIYSVLISVLSIIYFVLVYLIEKAFSVAMGYQSAILTVLAIVVLAIIFTPLKNRIQHAIDKYFFKGSIGEIEQEKHLLEDEIGRSERLKTISSLAAGMAHEIKNPLTSIKTFVEYVDKKYSDPEFKEKFKSIVPKEIDKIASIINQLLDYSKVDRISLRKVDIHKLLGYVTDLHSNEFIIKNIEAKISYEATNPIIKCDENKIKQAFINLILNSIEAMKKGGELSIHTKDIDNDIEIIIKDTGYGIAKDKLNKIFDPFFTTKEAGTGLGLFIVHQIVHNNNGKIGIESTEGRGTAVRVRFPRVI